MNQNKIKILIDCLEQLNKLVPTVCSISEQNTPIDTLYQKLHTNNINITLDIFNELIQTISNTNKNPTTLFELTNIINYSGCTIAQRIAILKLLIITT